MDDDAINDLRPVHRGSGHFGPRLFAGGRPPKGMRVHFSIGDAEHMERVDTENANFARDEIQTRFPGAVVWLILR